MAKPAVVKLEQKKGFVKSFFLKKDDSTVDEFQEELEVPYFEDGQEPARVSMSSEYTRQIKQYEPLKLSVFVSVPCAANEQEMLAALDFCENIMSRKLGEGKEAIDALCKVK